MSGIDNADTTRLSVGLTSGRRPLWERAAESRGWDKAVAALRDDVARLQAQPAYNSTTTDAYEIAADRLAAVKAEVLRGETT